jgi:tRNA nucleotidyltransferase (CCA-adding enzyme)
MVWNKMDKKTKKIKLDIPENIQDILRQLGSLGDCYKYKVFAVGGFVRDLLLGKGNLDIDIVVEGNGLKFAQILSGKLNGRLTIHGQFGTATIQESQESLPSAKGLWRDKIKIDIATARKEYYKAPASYPVVTFSSIIDDMHRRDFTINAMACSLNDDNFGEILDLCGGRQDIEKKIIRVLHKNSFIDDPTRIYRAIRFEQRYDFRIDKETESLIRQAINSGMLDKLSRNRIHREKELICREKSALNIETRLKDFTGGIDAKG